MAAIADDDLAQLYNQAREQLTGASDSQIAAALFPVLHDFFTVSSSWIENVPIAVVTNIQDYDVVPGDDGQIVRLGGVVDSNTILMPAIMPEVGVVHLRDPPSSNQTLTVTLVKTVCLPLDARKVPPAPDWTLKLFRTAIFHGVVGTLMLQPNKSYSNDQMSTYHLKKFEDGKSAARIAALRRNTLGSQAWVYPQGFRTRGQRGGVSAGNTLGF